MPNSTGVNHGDALSVLSIDVLDQNGNKIGAINQIAPSFSRPNTRVRDLDADAAGDVKDLVPGVENITISVNGFALRSTFDKKRGLLNRIPQASAGSAAFKSLKDNQIPFDIKEKQTNPRTGAIYTRVFKNCLLNNYSYSISMQGDVVISESASIDVSTVDEE